MPLKKTLLYTILILLLASHYLYSEVSHDLWSLSEVGWTEKINEILESDSSKLNNTDFEGKTPLHYAVLHDSSNVVDALIYYDVDTGIPDKNGNTPLHDAALYGKTETVSTLLNAGADASAYNKEGRTPLFTATEGGWIDVVRLLLKKEPGLVLDDGILQYSLGVINNGSAIKKRERVQIVNAIGKSLRQQNIDIENDIMGIKLTPFLEYLTGDAQYLFDNSAKKEELKNSIYSGYKLSDVAVILEDEEILYKLFENKIIVTNQIPDYIKTAVDYRCKKSFEYLKKRWYQEYDVPITYQQVLHSYNKNEFLLYDEIRSSFSFNGLDYTYAIGTINDSVNVDYSYFINDIEYGRFDDTVNNYWNIREFINGENWALSQDYNNDEEIVILADGRSFGPFPQIYPITIIDGVFYYSVNNRLMANNRCIGILRQKYRRYSNGFFDFGDFFNRNTSNWEISCCVDKYGRQFQGFLDGIDKLPVIQDGERKWSVYENGKKIFDSIPFDSVPEVDHTNRLMIGQREGRRLVNKRFIITEDGREYISSLGWEYMDFFDTEPLYYKQTNDETIILDYKNELYELKGPEPVSRRERSIINFSGRRSVIDLTSNIPVIAIEISNNYYYLLWSSGEYSYYSGKAPLVIINDGDEKRVISFGQDIILQSGEKLKITDFKRGSLESSSLFVRNIDRWGLLKANGIVEGNWDKLSVLRVKSGDNRIFLYVWDDNLKASYIIPENDEEYGPFSLLCNLPKIYISKTTTKLISMMFNNGKCIVSQNSDELIVFDNVIRTEVVDDWQLNRILTMESGRGGNDLTLTTMIF